MSKVGDVGATVVAGAVELSGKALGVVGKAIILPVEIPVKAALKVMSNHKVGTAVVGVAAAGAYLLNREDKVPEIADKAIAQLDAQGQQNAAMLDTMVAAQQLSPRSRIAANEAQYMGGQAFASAQVGAGSSR
jgi:hypothetical protein